MRQHAQPVQITLSSKIGWLHPRSCRWVLSLASATNLSVSRNCLRHIVWAPSKKSGNKNPDANNLTTWKIIKSVDWKTTISLDLWTILRSAHCMVSFTSIDVAWVLIYSLVENISVISHLKEGEGARRKKEEPKEKQYERQINTKSVLKNILRQWNLCILSDEEELISNCCE